MYARPELPSQSTKSAVPAFVGALADDLGVQLEHRSGEVRPADRVHVARYRGEIVEGQLGETPTLENLDQLEIPHVAIVAELCQLLLNRMGWLQRQEVREDVDIAGDDPAIASHRKFVIS